MTTPSTPADRAARLRELLSKATPGPWESAEGHVRHKQIVLLKHAHDAYPWRVSGERGHFSAKQRQANAALIVEAINALPALLTEHDEMAGRIERLKRVLVEAAIPLEALNMDNGIGAKWMAPEMRAEVANAVAAIRRTLSPVPGTEADR